ncbi:hypothetical protein LAZ67_1001743, partial [Cordylochernes scorpioides]
MEISKRHRNLLRKRLTRSLKTTEEFLSGTPPIPVEDIENNREIIEETHSELLVIQGKIRDFMLTSDVSEEELEQDDEEALQYTQRYKRIYKKCLALVEPRITASSPTTSEVSFASSSHHRTVKLPKIELKKFTGEIKDWLGWWAQFNKINVDPTLEDSDKFQYLVQSMSPGTRASKLVNSYPLTAENYPKVIETLTERFGRPELLQQVYVRDLIRLMIDCSSKQQLKVTSFYDELVTHLRALESLKIEARQMSVFIFPMIEACLSEELMKTWQRSPLHDVKIDVNDSTQTRVDLIMEFLQKEAAAEQDRALAGSKFGLRSLKQDRNVGRQSHPAKIPTASGLFAGRAQNCIFCNKDHKKTECLAARRMSIKERRERIKYAKCCLSCLQPGHISSNCRRRITECNRCKKKHLDILCPLNAPGRESADEDKEQVEDCDVSPTVENGVSFSGLSASSLILLQTLKIKVEGATSAKVVRALLDTGSQRSYILSKTAQDLGLSPIGQESLKHVVFGGHTSESVHQEYRVNLGHASGNFKMVAKLLDHKKSVIQPPETFDFSTPNEWPRWRKRFERYLVVSGMKKKEEADKIDLFMYLMGDRADDIFRTFKFEKEEEATKIDSVLKAFDSHFCVRKNIIYERAKFNSRIQEDREPVDEFITSLYKLADSCEFEGLHEQLIRDRIVVGVRDKALSERMQLDSELTLEKAVKMVRQQEAVRQQQVDLQRPSTSQKVNQVKFNSKKQSPKQQQQPSRKKEKSAKTRSRCPKCGGFTHREGQACRAEGQKCNLCSKTGHFANCCPDKQAKTAEVKAVYELDEEIGFLLEVSAVEDSSNLDNDEDECRRRWTAEIQVNGKKVKFKLDSQADVTCVPLCLFKKIMGQQRLVESDINIRAAEFSELQTVGMFISTLRNGIYEIKEIYVIRRLSEPLLSRRACELLNLARRIEVVATRINPIKDEMLTNIFEAQQEDTTLKAVVNYLEQGWPDKNKMSQALLSYWHVKDELGVQNGLLMRSCRLVIPASMKLEILDKLHAGHFGITKTRLRARETVWWPGISEEIAETVRKCSVCIQEAVSKHEPLIPTNFPTRPWQKIGMDLFKFENKWYLVAIDYYSRFPEMIQLDRLTASVVVRSCKSIFARHGIPETVVSDNGTQFGAAREFANFARQYGFTHVTSSPRFPQSNGMAEAGVKIAKLILKKNQDPSLGLLEYRSTPLENGYSPAELLMGRKLRTTLPIAPENLNPKLVDSQTLKRKEGRRRKDMKSRYDRRCGATDMEELSEGDTVWITDMRTWGIVKQKASTPRSYMVDTPVGTLRRNRFHLRKGYAVQYPADPSTPTFSGEELVENEKTPVVDYPSNDSEDGQIRTRSGRIVKPDYDDIFRGWLDDGIIEKVPAEQHDAEAFYLPHRPVVKLSSGTTPIRPVFDASSKVYRSPSLNDCLEKGPNLIEMIPNLMLRFRNGKFGVMADIKKAFLQIEVNERDRDYLRFLWYSQNGEKTEVFRHRRVVFGVNCSPFILGAVIKYHLSNVRPEHKPLAQRLQKSFYVDNLVTSVNSFEELQDLKLTATSIMDNARLELSRWEHSLDVASDTHPFERAEISKVLGVCWDKREDCLSCEIPVAIPPKITKRSILSCLAQIYDPIGFLNPILIKPKILLQKVWIKRDNQLGTFVGNRVKEICRLSDPGNWRYVPSECNPADLPSRGCSLSRLIQSRWWEGPSWLKLSEEFWPSRYKDLNEEEICAKRMLGTSTLTYHQLMTLLCHAEAVMNGRPMTYVSDDPNDLVTISPSMFLQEQTDVEFTECQNMGHNPTTQKLRYLSKLREELKSRFRKEYLSLLVQRNRRIYNPKLQAGDVVLVGMDNKKRNFWPLAVIEEILFGRDGVNRLVKVKTAVGTFLRPIQKIYPLEISSTAASSRLLNDKMKTAKIQTRSGRTICKPNRLDDYLCFSVCLDKNRWECVWNGGDPFFRTQPRRL